jgi:flagellar motor switch protein FliM
LNPTEREAERAAEKEQWAAQLLQEVDTARVEAEGKIEQAQVPSSLARFE